ncbi:hypothetical protein GCM10010168_29550 [Actinoplanes ianthinogenes]|uniref:Excalibur calcium-binding domain-containing protein n=1 Tax=Actinoplanes ianthinogenes TaxID=122358 RepID=A0ABM7LLE8_9ACTN|nr:hypothetical protein Aiant_07540 [Actinoplanes ianthinogenes]GGR10258.1 hypothetical protein GCM10010168_29550 [Actinoplanes ianthinogenes]
MRQALGDLGLPVGGAAVDAGAARIVHRLVGVDRLVTDPAPPAVTCRNIFQKTHRTNLPPEFLSYRSDTTGALDREGGIGCDK